MAFNGISRTQSDDTKFCPTPYLCLRDVDDETVGLTGCLDHKTGINKNLKIIKIINIKIKIYTSNAKKVKISGRTDFGQGGLSGEDVTLHKNRLDHVSESVSATRLILILN